MKNIQKSLFLFIVVAFLCCCQTSLKIVVLNETGNAESGVKVALYEKEDDYNNSTKPVFVGETNDKGEMKVPALQPKKYFIEAKKGDKSNIDRGEHTEKLTKKKQNKVHVIIE